MPMASGRIFTANVVLSRSPGGEPVKFAIGDEVPEWAIKRVGEHASQGVTRSAEAPAPAAPINDNTVATPAEADAAVDEEDDVDSYTTWTKDELKDEARAREIEGFSKMTKDELVAALEADDAEDN